MSTSYPHRGLPTLGAWELLDRIAPLPAYLLEAADAPATDATDAPQARQDARTGDPIEWAVFGVLLLLATACVLVLGMVR